MRIPVCLLACFTALTLSAFDFSPYERIVCFGDSITHGGYWHMYLQQYFAENDPGHPRRFINRGINGNRVSQLLERVDSMLQQDKPDLVMILIGTNDLLSAAEKFAEKDLPFREALEKYPVFRKFEAEFEQLLERLNQAGVSVVVLSTPPYNESKNPKVTAWLDANMNSSGVRNLLPIEERLAWEKGAAWIDIYTPMLKNLQDNDAGMPRWERDRVHPSKSEHLLIAQTILGHKWIPGKAKAAAAEKYRQAQEGVEEILFYNYYYVPSSCKTAEEKIAYYRKWVSSFKGWEHDYWNERLPGIIEQVKDPEGQLRKQYRKCDEAFAELYK